MQAATRHLNEKEAASIVGVSVFTLRYKRVHGGGPLFRKIGSRVVYPEDMLVEWLNSHELRAATRKDAA